MKKELARKLIHLSSLIYPLLYLFLASKKQMLILTSSVLFILCIVDFARYKNENFKNLSNKIFGIFSREAEKSGSIYGSTYFMLGVFLTILLFDKSTAILSVLILIISDALASIIGKLIKSPKLYKQKSVSGFLAFVFSAICILSIFTKSIFVICFVAVLTAIAELLSQKIKIDDNLLIPLTSGLFYSTFTYLF